MVCLTSQGITFKMNHSLQPAVFNKNSQVQSSFENIYYRSLHKLNYKDTNNYMANQQSVVVEK